MKKPALLLLFLIYGCGTDSESDLQEPVIEGILMTNSSGFEIGQWRTPAPPEPNSDEFRLIYPFPNPVSGNVVIEFVVESTRHVEIWILPARLQEENESRYVQEYGPDSVADGRIVTLLDSKMLQGIHMLNWGLDGSPVDRLPMGFYRVFAESEGEVLWHDLFIGNPGQSRQSMINFLNSLDD